MATEAKSEQFMPLVMEENAARDTVPTRCHWSRAAPAASMALLVSAAALVILYSRWPEPSTIAPSAQKVLETAAELRTCVDTAGWTSSHAGCQGAKGGNDPELCKRGVGWTCLAYKRNGWCSDGLVNYKTSRQFVGPDYNLPEENCCVCGGGRGLETIGKLKRVMAELQPYVDKAIPMVYALTSRFAGIAPATKNYPFARFSAPDLLHTQVHTLKQLIWRDFNQLVRIMPSLGNATAEIMGIESDDAVPHSDVGLEWAFRELASEFAKTNITIQAMFSKRNLYNNASELSSIPSGELMKVNNTITALGRFFARIIPALIRGAQKRTWALSTLEVPDLIAARVGAGAVTAPARPACASNLANAWAHYIDTEGWLNYMAEDCAASNWGQGTGSSILALECAIDAAHSTRMLAKALGEIADSMLNCAYLDFSCEQEFLTTFAAISTMAAATLEAIAVCPNKNTQKCTVFALNAAEALSIAEAHVHLALERCTNKPIVEPTPLNRTETNIMKRNGLRAPKLTELSPGGVKSRDGLSHPTSSPEKMEPKN